MKPKSPRNIAARQWAMENLPVAIEIAERFDGTLVWAQGILKDARKEVAQHEPERMKEQERRIALAREARRAGEHDPLILAENFGITPGHAKSIIRRATWQEPKKTAKKLSGIEEARRYAATHDVTGYKLRKMFDLSMETARRIASEANNGSPTRLQSLQENHQKALTHAYAIGGRISARELADMFGIGQYKARDIVLEVLADMRMQSSQPAPKQTRIVRRFRDLSGTDATADRVRYPSGIGFGVVEVVR
jgi:hypothetical protein